MAETKKKTVIYQDEWDQLQPSDRRMLEAIGFKPEKRKVHYLPPTTKAFPLQEYHILLTTICTICNSNQVSTYSMLEKGSPRNPCLKSTPCSFRQWNESELREKETLYITGCKHCRERLLNKDKEKLIEMILNYAKMARLNSLR